MRKNTSHYWLLMLITKLYNNYVLRPSVNALIRHYVELDINL